MQKQVGNKYLLIYFCAFWDSLEGKKLAVLSHWYESISHWEKAEAHKGKVIFYLH